MKPKGKRLEKEVDIMRTERMKNFCRAAIKVRYRKNFISAAEERVMHYIDEVKTGRALSDKFRFVFAATFSSSSCRLQFLSFFKKKLQAYKSRVFNIFNINHSIYHSNHTSHSISRIHLIYKLVKFDAIL